MSGDAQDVHRPCLDLLPRRGTQPGGGQDPADRPFPHPVPQAEQVALNPPVAPAGVLPSQLLRERADLGWNRRSSRRIRVGPFPCDWAAVPRPAGCPGSRSGAAASARADGRPRRRAPHGQPSPASGGAACRRDTALARSGAGDHHDSPRRRSLSATQPAFSKCTRTARYVLMARRLSQTTRWVHIRTLSSHPWTGRRNSHWIGAGRRCRALPGF
jgi:hypothetical protein